MINTVEDPYLIPGTRTLNNKFGITDPAKLQDLEIAIYIRLNVTSLLEKGDLDYTHLNIHRHLFGKLSVIAFLKPVRRHELIG